MPYHNVAGLVDCRSSDSLLSRGVAHEQGEKYATRPISELDVTAWEVRARGSGAPTRTHTASQHCSCAAWDLQTR